MIVNTHFLLVRSQRREGSVSRVSLICTDPSFLACVICEDGDVHVVRRRWALDGYPIVFRWIGFGYGNHCITRKIVHTVTTCSLHNTKYLVSLHWQEDTILSNLNEVDSYAKTNFEENFFQKRGLKWF